MRTTISIPFTTPYETDESMNVVVEVNDSLEATVFFPVMSIHKLYNKVNYYVLEMIYPDLVNDEQSKQYEIDGYDVDETIGKRKYIINTYDNIACTPFTYKSDQYYEESIDSFPVLDDNITYMIYPVEEDILEEDIVDGKTTVDLTNYIYEWSEIGVSNAILTEELKLTPVLEYENGKIIYNILNVLDLTTFKAIVNISMIDIYNNLYYTGVDVNLDDLESLDVSSIMYVDDVLIPFNPGMQISSILSIYHNSNDGYEENITQIKSNTIPITYEIYQDILFWIENGDSVVDLINNAISEIENEEEMNINIVSKTIVEEVNVSTPSSSQGVSVPVFYRTVDLSDIVLRSDITDKIQINLDIYKSKVDSFYIKIGNFYYPEYARITGGVIFSINGTEISSVDSSGRYYICNQDYDVVTSGNYTIE